MHLFNTCIESEPGNFPLTCSKEPEMTGSKEGKGDWVPLVDMMAERRRIYKGYPEPESAKHLRVVFLGLALLLTTLASFLAT